MIGRLIRTACETCGRYFRREPAQAWRTRCVFCWQVQTETVSCEACRSPFRRVRSQTYRTRCMNCWRADRGPDLFEDIEPHNREDQNNDP